MCCLQPLTSIQSVLYYVENLADSPYEKAQVLLLDKHNFLLKILNFSDHLPHQLILPAREIFKPAFCYDTSQFILVHNHPSGQVCPSQEDHQTTERLALVGRYLNINLLDHIIVVPNDYFSFSQAGVLSGYLRP